MVIRRSSNRSSSTDTRLKITDVSYFSCKDLYLIPGQKIKIAKCRGRGKERETRGGRERVGYGITDPSRRGATLRPSPWVGLRLFQSEQLFRPERFVMDLRRSFNQVLQVCPKNIQSNQSSRFPFRRRKHRTGSRSYAGRQIHSAFHLRH
jgi:hypothetical protein